MGLQDLIITPIYLAIFLILGYLLRDRFTTPATRKYFLPALAIRFFGAIAVGFIYQYYYSFGDTFNFFKQAGVIHQAFIDDPVIGLKLIFSDGTDPILHEYTSQIIWYRAPSEFFVIKVVAILSVFTGHTYTATALFFAVFSFIGAWSMFSALSTYGRTTLLFAIAVLFIPSVIFWGSGILKDTLTLAALGLFFRSAFHIVENRRITLLNILVILFTGWVIYSIKLYILICLIPAMAIWWYLKNLRVVSNQILRWLLAPAIGIIFLSSGYVITDQLASTSKRYNLNSLAEWSYITSYDIRYFSGKDAGSGYSLGEQDGTWATLIPLIPSAINVSLFRPYFWEVKNPLMLLSALEALLFGIITLSSFRKVLRRRSYSPLILFFLTFSMTFAFAVGVSTYNFGSLSRYKLPLIPCYACMLVLLRSPNYNDS